MNTTAHKMAEAIRIFEYLHNEPPLFIDTGRKQRNAKVYRIDSRHRHYEHLAMPLRDWIDKLYAEYNQ